LAISTLSALSQSACDRDRPGEKPTESAPAPQPPTVKVPPLSPKLSRAAPERLVAIGDLHGDLDHARRALRLAGAIDDKDHWIGGKLVVVQTGDEIDRGDDDRAILELVDRLKGEASRAGGEFIALLGNHEIMNASLDFRYVTDGGFAAFAAPFAPFAPAPSSSRPDGGATASRTHAFEPGGPYAHLLANRPFFAKVGDSVFVHGGILPKHVAYGLDRINDELDSWLDAKRSAPPSILVAEDGPVWTRAYSKEDGQPDCADLDAVLDELGASRMVVGHTVQRDGINSACGRKVWRIDVGLSRFFGGPVQVLELRGDQVTVLKEQPAP
jgi:hypothetical protein